MRLLFLFPFFPLLKTAFAVNLTSTPLPTSAPMQSYTPTTSVMPMTQTELASHTVTSTYSPQYTPSSVSSFSPNVTQTHTPVSISVPTSSQVSIYDSNLFKAGVGVSIGILIIAIILCGKSANRPQPYSIGQTNPIVGKIYETQPFPMVHINKPQNTDIVTGKVLADGWKSVSDESGDVWYVNSVTGESSWTAKYKD
jgi:hypothetical protein